MLGIQMLGKKMKHIAGLFDSNKEFKGQELERECRICFDTNDDRVRAYFFLISPVFEEYAQRQAGVGINFINVLFIINETHFSAVLSELNTLKSKFSNHPKSWNEFIGTKKIGNKPEIIISPLIVKNRVIRIISTIENLVTVAKKSQKIIVYGNGVCYRRLSGQKPVPGVITYS